MTNMGTMDPKNNSFATDTFFDSSVDISNSKTLNQRTALAMIPINITNIPPTSATSTARASGKLSTRHSRLKRKRREKDSSKVKERVPIPSFSCSPIRDDSDQDDISRARYKSASGGGDTTNNDRPLKIMKSSSTCSHKRDALESTAIEVTTLVSSSAKSEKESSSATQHALIESRNEKAMTLAENNSKNPVESIINVDPISTSIINNPTKEQVGCKKDAPPQDNIDQLSDTKELKSLKKGETETNVDTSVKTNKLPALVKPSSFSNVPKDVGGGNKDIYNTSNLNDEVGCIQSNQPIITTSTSSSRFIIPNAYVGASAPQIVEKRDEQITTVPDPPSNSIIQRKHNEIKVATSKYVYQPSLSSPEMDPSDQSKQNHHRHEQSTPKSHDKTENVAVNSSSGDHTVRSSAVPAPSIEKQNPVLQSESVPLGPKSKSLGLTKSGVQKLFKKNKKNKNNPLCESVANTANASKDEIGCKNSLTTEPENIASDKVRRSGISISQKPTSREACGKVNIGMVKTVRAAGQKDSNSIGNGSSANDIQSDTLPSKQPSAVFTKSPYLGGSKKRAGQDSNIINVGQGSKDTRKHRGSTEDIRIMDYYGGNAETKSSKYFGSVKSNSDVIEIVDDEEEVIDMVKPEKELPKKGGTSPNGKKDVKKRHNSSKPSKTRKKNKAPISVSRVFATDSSDDDSEVVATQEKKPVDRKRHRRQTKNSAEAKKCVACSSCKCNSRDSNVKHAPFSNLAGSDARVEQSLVNRLQQLERDAARTEGRRYDVARDLKKHRNRMLKKWEADAPDDQPRFLADAEVSEEWSFALSKGKVDPKKVDRVRGLVFGKNKTCQPTLTQAFRGSKKHDSGDSEGSIEPKTCCPVESEMNIERSVDIVLSTSDDGCVGNRSTSFGDEVDFLSCWSSPTKPTDTSQYNVGSMNDFTEAAARFSKKEPNNLNMEFGDTAMWANATARSLRIHNALESSHGIRCGNDLLETDSIEEDDASCNVKGGLDALLELFDATISNASNGLNDHSQKSIQEDNFDSDEKNLFDPDACLTPRGKKVAEGIEGALVEDNNKLDVIKRSCPNWKENIRYAQLQTDPQEVDAAFQKVIEARKNLAKMKESIMQAFLERDSTLELYEQSLKGSLKRLVGVDDT